MDDILTLDNKLKIHQRHLQFLPFEMLSLEIPSFM